MTIKIYSGKGSLKKCYEENLEKGFFVMLDKKINTKIGKTKTFAAFKDIDSFYKWRRSEEGKKYPANFYEIIKEDSPCIEYYDIDAYTNRPGPYHNLTGDEIVESFISARMEYHIEMLGDYNIPLRRGDFYITSTPGKDKVSLHIYIRNGFMFKNNNIHLKTFVKDFKKYCEIEDLPVEIDDSVYSKNRAFRLINNYKIGQKDRVCVAYNNKNKSKKDFLAVNVEGITKYYFEKDIITETIEEIETINEIYKDSKENKIFLLLTLIEDTIATGKSPLCDTEYKNKVNYRNFFNLAVALLNSCKEGDKERLFDKAFALYRHADPADKDIQYNKLLHYNYTDISIKSLHYWARFSEEYLNYFKKEDEEYREFEKIRRFEWMKKKAFDNRDKPIIEYGRELRSLTNKTKRKPPLLSTVERTLIKLMKYVYANGAECYFIDNEYYDLKEGKRICEYEYESRCNFMRQVVGKGSITVNYINESYIEDRKEWLKELENPNLTPKQKLKLEAREPQPVNKCLLLSIIDSLLEDGKLKQYTNLTFMPYLYKDKDISKDNLNLFRGYTYKVRDKPKIERYKNSKFRKNIRKYLCNNDKNFADWFEKWIAHAIQKPMEKCTVMTVFVGAQGTGKDLLYGALRHIIGRRYTGELTGMEPLFERFNGCLDRKLFIRMNEIKTKGKQFANAGKLKDIIDRRFITIEQKYKEKYEGIQVVRFIGFSNEEDILVLDKDDRRFSIINTNDEKAQNKEYFKSIVAELSEEFYMSMFDYYATLDISDFNPLKPCDSKFKCEQKKYNESKPILMLLDWYKDKDLNKNVIYKYTLKEILNNQWVMWCHNTHYTKALDMGYITFNKHIKKILPVKRNANRVLSVEFNYEMLRDGFRKYYKDQSFEL